MNPGLKLTGTTLEGASIEFRFNDIQHIIRDHDLLLMYRGPHVRFSTVEVITTDSASPFPTLAKGEAACKAAGGFNQPLALTGAEALA